MSTQDRIRHGISWTYGAQLAIVAAQIAYSAATSRLVGANVFGLYAASLSITGLVALIGAGGIGQAIARIEILERGAIRAMLSSSILLGIVSGGTLFLTAAWWANLWGVPAATPTVRLLAISTFLTPILALTSGLMTRLGKFRMLGISTLYSNILGMLFGVFLVYKFRSPTSLVAASLIAQAILIIVTIFASDRLLYGLAHPNKARSLQSFSVKLTLASGLSYLTGNIVKIGLSRFIGPASLGYWNRAEVLTSIPFQQVQTAIIRTIYPEFRHDVDASQRARVVWTDMLILSSWLALPLSALAAAVVPILIPVIFGPSWAVAAALAAPFALIGALQLISTILGSAIEGIGKFPWVWSTDFILIVLQIFAFVLLYFNHQIAIAVIALILTNVVRHIWQVWLASRAGYLNASRLYLNYLIVAACAIPLYIITRFICHELFKADHSVVLILCGLGFAATYSAILVYARDRLPVISLLRTYGLARRGSQ